jgi:peptidoglycan/xylan/chitin deacetylase (PgdA/CDA1 family)
LKDFSAQMEVLARHGKKGVPLSELSRQARLFNRWPDDMIGLTFDDGYSDCLQWVMPVLANFHFSATVFVITDALKEGRKGPIAFCPAHKEFLSSNDLGTLRDGGWEIGSHGCDHSRLAGLPPARQERQIRDSKVLLEDVAARSVDSFCYPAGKLDAHSLDLVETVGYRQAPVTPWRSELILPGCWFTLERVGIYRGDQGWKFLVKLSPLFRWLRSLRHAFAVRPPASSA